MVTHHLKDGQPPFKIYQKEVYYRIEIWHMDLTHKNKKTGEVQMVSPHLRDGHPTSQNLPEVSVLQTWNLVPKDGHPQSQNLPEGSELQTWNLPLISQN